MRAFGCLCFPWLRPYSEHKLASRSKPCVFVGYSNTHHTYKCLDISSNRLYLSRHVQFFEHQFSFASHSSSVESSADANVWAACSPALAALYLPAQLVPAHPVATPPSAPPIASPASPRYGYSPSPPILPPFPLSNLISPLLPYPILSWPSLPPHLPILIP